MSEIRRQITGKVMMAAGLVAGLLDGAGAAIAQPAINRPGMNGPPIEAHSAMRPTVGRQPGTLVSSDAVAGAPAGMRAWRITYWTTSAAGAPRLVSGMVAAPDEQDGPAKGDRRVLAWTHGTWGVAQRCAPSLSPAFFTATPALDAVRQGYVVIAPDYPGLGSAGANPYLVGEDTARSVLDAVRAVQAIRPARAGSRFALWGESQGGHAALWSAAAAPRYAPELALVGTAAAAPPTDLVANFRQGTSAETKAMLTAFTAASWQQHYRAPLGTLFNKPTQGVVMRLARNNCIELGKTPRIGTLLGVVAVKNALRGKDLGTIQPWARLLDNNSVNPLLVRGPVLIAQTVNDPVVAPQVTRAFAQRLCRMRSPLRYVSLPGGDHGHTGRDSAAQTLAWMDGRFRGEAPPNDCAGLR